MLKKRTLFLSLILSLSVVVNATAAEATNPSSNIASFEADSLTKTDGSFWIWGQQQSVPTQVSELAGVTQSFGQGLVQKQDHSVWVWQPDYRNTMVKVQPVSGMSNISGAITNGRTIAWDAEGKVYTSVTLDDHWDLTKFEAVSGIDHVADVKEFYLSNDKSGISGFIFLKQDGTVWKDDGSLHIFTPIQNLSQVVQIERNMALKQDGTVWTWSDNVSGTGSLPESMSASQIKSLSGIKQIKHNLHSQIAIDNQSRIWWWGATVTGISDSAIMTEHNKPTLLTGVKNVKEAFAVEDSLVVVTSDNKVYTSFIGMVNVPASANFKLLASDVVAIRNGTRHIIMQKKDGSLWGWGVNKQAALGNGDYEFMHNEPVPMQKPISISLNGENVDMTSGVITRNGQNFVPLRSVFEKLGAEIGFDFYSKQATVSRKTDGKLSLAITVNAATGKTTLNNSPVELENKPFNVNGTLYLPLRFISEKLGAKVDWLAQEERISITMK